MRENQIREQFLLIVYMDWDNTSNFVLTADASAQAIGARLGRIDKKDNIM